MAALPYLRWCGMGNLLGGVLAALFLLIHPDSETSMLLSPAAMTFWIADHAIGVIGMLLGLIGLIGLYARQANQAGTLGLAGFLILFLGMGLSLGVVFGEAFFLPAVAVAEPRLLGEANPLSVMPAALMYVVPAMLFALGCVLFGIATMRAGVLPRWAGTLLIGGLLFYFPSGPDFPIPAFVITASIGLYGLAQAWLGIALWNNRDQVDHRLAVAAS